MPGSRYPPRLESLRLILPDCSDYPDDLPIFKGSFAEMWSPILSLKQLTTLELNSLLPVDGPIHPPFINKTRLETLLINNGPGCGETTRITSFLLGASDKLASFSWLNSPFPVDFKRTNSSDTQSVWFCLPVSLVHLRVCGMSEEENEDSSVAESSCRPTGSCQTTGRIDSP